MSVSTFLGWFAILEVLVLKSRDSRFSWSLTLLAWCLEFWVPYPVAPLPRMALWFFRLSRGAHGAPPDIWPRASVSLLAFDLPLAWSLRLWGDPCLGVQWLSFRVRVLCPLLRHVDVALQDLPCSSVGGLHCPGPVNARIIAWEIDFSLGERSGFLACLGRRIVCRCVPFLFVPGYNVVRSSISVSPSGSGCLGTRVRSLVHATVGGVSRGSVALVRSLCVFFVKYLLSSWY